MSCNEQGDSCPSELPQGTEKNGTDPQVHTKEHQDSHHCRQPILPYGPEVAAGETLHCKRTSGGVPAAQTCSETYDD